MAKVLKNTTGSDIFLNDVGITIAASSYYTIPEQDYPLWAASSDVVTYLTSGDLLANDGDDDYPDYNPQAGIDLIKNIARAIPHLPMYKVVVGKSDGTAMLDYTQLLDKNLDYFKRS